MESPRDAADYMEEESVAQDFPSFWNFREVKDMAAWMKATYVHLDQGAVGHAKRKPTTLLVANMSDMEELQGISGEGTGQETPNLFMLQSREWSARAPGLVAAIQESLIRYWMHMNLVNHMSVKLNQRCPNWTVRVGRNMFEITASTIPSRLLAMHGDDGN